MVIGTLIKFMAITQDFETVHIPIFDTDMSGSVACASLGFAIFGVGYEMTGITVSKAMVRWFTGHELALAMGIQLAMARLGTAAALSISAYCQTLYAVNPFALIFGIPDDRLAGIPCLLCDGSTIRRIHTFRNRQLRRVQALRHRCHPPLMVMKYGVDADIAGFFSSIAPFGTILMTPLFGLIYDRYGKGVTLVITGALMLTAVHFGFSLPIHSSTIAIALMVILSIGYSLAPAALWPCVPKIIPLKCLGTAYSMIFFIQNFGRAIIPMFIGRANETDPSYTTSMLIFGFTALGAALTAIAMYNVNRKKGYGLQLPNIKK